LNRSQATLWAASLHPLEGLFIEYALAGILKHHLVKISAALCLPQEDI
jgi:hypothetical protein